jgi:ATP-binding cassette subfamily F protein uup
MDRLVDHLFIFEGEGQISDFPGNYSQYREAENNTKKVKPNTPSSQKVATQHNAVVAETSMEEKKKLSYNEKRELESLDREIPQLEAEKAKLEQLISGNDLDYEVLQGHAKRIGEISQLLDDKELRWLALDERR